MDWYSSYDMYDLVEDLNTGRTFKIYGDES